MCRRQSRKVIWDMINTSLLLRRFVFRMAEASAKREWLVLNCKGPWEGAPSGLSLRARFKERRLGTRQWSIHWFWRLYLSNLLLMLSFSTRKHISTAFRTNSFKFLSRTVNLKPPAMPFGIVACTFSDNFSRNSCKYTCWNSSLRLGGRMSL